MNTKHEKFRNKNHTHIRCWKPFSSSTLPHLPFFLLLTLPFLSHDAFHVANGNRPLENEIRFAFCTHAYPHTHTHTQMGSHTNHPHAATRTTLALWASANRLRNSNYEFCLQSKPRHRPRDRAWTRCRRRLSLHTSYWIALTCRESPPPCFPISICPSHSKIFIGNARREATTLCFDWRAIFNFPSTARVEYGWVKAKDSPWRNDSRRNSRFTHWMQLYAPYSFPKLSTYIAHRAKTQGHWVRSKDRSHRRVHKELQQAHKVRHPPTRVHSNHHSRIRTFFDSFLRFLGAETKRKRSRRSFDCRIVYFYIFSTCASQE